ncbi:UDP-3-O-(3-hydroxymyristoyl)glucosamine N-acyltransferase [Fulvivirgaceae bacterium BMA10]|uniref:UDP-3-O-acylglucosamine N-acyltransferase n=1 Tax=Splendidivirga corallicola TaxID=3051826 RepID=A0ABT8KSI2_9BACT|nr:UDP-3-O-(3-hydroxymyristoyl)glucosamine N-acyltransferase [Fulvivirgaceae bacterium BMA10]
MEFTVNQIAGILGGEVQGNGELTVHKLATIQDAKKGCISFLSNPKYENYIYSTEATAIIVKEGFMPKSSISATLIFVQDPYLSFTVLLEEYHKIISFQKKGVEDPSYIGKNSKTGEGIYRGAFSYIGENTSIGNNVKIYPQAYIGDNVKIGDNTIIHPGVKIYANSIVGNNCVFHSGVVIGSDGFGFAPQSDGSYKTIPQLGNVVIEDNVDIGANTVIDCATLESTIIRKGVKLDNLIQIAHNVEIGKNTVIAAQSGISGSSKLGENCIIAGQVGIVGHLEIGNRVTVGAQSGVPKSLKDDTIATGSPAIDHKQYLRTIAVYRNLPELNERIKQLEEKILNLPTFKQHDEH